MKTKLSTFIILALFVCISAIKAQAPQGFNYQAVARTDNGNPIINTVIPVRITIQSDSLGGTIFWKELHSTVTTNSFGLFSLVLGKGAKQAGSTAVTFNAIDWSVSPKFIKTEIDYGGWKNMGSSRLWSVPYALMSAGLTGSLKKLNVDGTTNNLEEALFEVKNNLGQTVFAVYNEGVRIYVDNGDAKGVKGGFAIGGLGTGKAPGEEYFRVTRDSTRISLSSVPSSKGVKGGFAIGGLGTGKGPGEEYLRVTRDSTRISLNTIPSKGVKGGFAIGGLDPTKGSTQDFLKVSPDSIRMYINDNPATKGVKGGFAIGGFDASKGLTPSFMQLNRENYFIGHETGKSNTTGVHNLIFGYQAGVKNTTGSRNVFIGELSGNQNLYGYNNVFLGYNAGMNNAGTTFSDQGSNNVYIGTNAGKASTLGVANTFVGSNAGQAVTSGVLNTFVGTGAGYSSLNCSDNTFIGVSAGRGNTTGYSNICIGNSSGESLNSGYNNIAIGMYAGKTILYASDNILIGAYAGQYLRATKNTIIGHSAGYNLGTSSAGNILIGYQAGYNETGSDKLYIDNSSTSSPLIGGDFSTNRVGINRIPTTYTFEVGGSIWANGSSITVGATTWSDGRYKTDITTFENGLGTILKLRGVRYNWKREDFPDLNFSEGGQIGVIAQEVEEVLPELVYTSPDGYKSVSYEKLTPVLVEAIKEQQKIIESQSAELEALKDRLEKIEIMLAGNR